MARTRLLFSILLFGLGCGSQYAVRELLPPGTGPDLLDVPVPPGIAPDMARADLPGDTRWVIRSDLSALAFAWAFRPGAQVEGRIVATRPGALFVHDVAGERVGLAVGPGTRVVRQGQSVGVAALAPGQEVRASFDARNGTLQARTVELLAGPR